MSLRVNWKLLQSKLVRYNQLVKSKQKYLVSISMNRYESNEHSIRLNFDIKMFTLLHSNFIAWSQRRRGKMLWFEKASLSKSRRKLHNIEIISFSCLSAIENLLWSALICKISFHILFSSTSKVNFVWKRMSLCTSWLPNLHQRKTFFSPDFRWILMRLFKVFTWCRHDDVLLHQLLIEI